MRMILMVGLAAWLSAAWAQEFSGDEFPEGECLGCGPPPPEVDIVHLGKVSTGQVQGMLKNGTAVVLDVRGEGAYRAGHLPQARHVTVSLKQAEAEAFIHDDYAEVIVYGDRAEQVGELLIDWGYRFVSVYPDGLSGWQAAGGEVERKR